MRGGKWAGWLWVPVSAVHWALFVDAGMHPTPLAAALVLMGVCQNVASAMLALTLAGTWLVTAVLLWFPEFRRLGFAVAILSQALAVHLSFVRLSKPPLEWDCFASYLNLPPSAAIAFGSIVGIAALVGFNQPKSAPTEASRARVMSATWAVASVVLALAFLVPRVQHRDSLWLNAKQSFLTHPRFLELRKVADHGSGPMLVVFSDYQCPGCREEDAELKKALQNRMVRQSSVRFANLPLSRIHPFALRAAVLAESVPADDFWPLHHRLMEADLSAEDLDRLQSKLLPNGGDALKTGRERVERDALIANRLGLIQTPTIFVLTDQYALQLPTVRDAVRWIAAP